MCILFGVWKLSLTVSICWYGQGISVMVFSTDETTNKAVVYAGVPENGEKFKQLEVSEWLTAALGPLKGRCGKGKGGLAQGQVSHFLLLFELLDLNP